ncbi:MAG: DUF2147 domain-containing protein [Methylophilaceae bacterium]
MFNGIKKLLLLCLLLIPHLVFAGNSGTPVGLWKSFDDQGKHTGYIRITEQQGLLRGVIERGTPDDGQDRRCNLCKDARKDQLMLGMEIIWNLKSDGDDYVGGEILDPLSGNVYRAKLTVFDGGAKLKVRGYLGISLFGRTQIWTREE